MILADIRNYLRDRGQASLVEIARHCDADPAAVRDMLQVWIRKGHIKRQLNANPCGGCTQCDPMASEIYNWVSGSSVTRRPASCRLDE
jgi:hypothetical protein